MPTTPSSSCDAVVLGCGVAGIAAAAALAQVGLEVVIVEQDAIPRDPAPRRGVPQSRQLHNLLSRAQIHLEDVLPAFREAFAAAGGTQARVAADTHVQEFGMVMPERDLGLELWCAPQPLIEHVARSLLPAHVLVLDQRRATRLRIGRDSTLQGLDLEGGEHLRSPLLVDARGAGTSALTQLRQAGGYEPPVTTVQVDQWYATSVVRRPSREVGRPDFWLAFPTPPSTRGTLVSPSGDRDWHVSTSGRSGDIPPRSWDDVLAHVSSHEALGINDLLAEARPLADPRLHRRPVAVWRRYDQLDRLPVGYLPIGDALATLNPLHGQGVSVAAWEASVLADVVARETTWDGITTQYTTRTAHCVGRAWALDSVGDRLEPRDWQELGRRIWTDPATHRRYVGMWHLLEDATWLDGEQSRTTHHIDTTEQRPSEDR